MISISPCEEEAAACLEVRDSRANSLDFVIEEMAEEVEEGSQFRRVERDWYVDTIPSFMRAAWTVVRGLQVSEAALSLEMWQSWAVAMFG